MKKTFKKLIVSTLIIVVFITTAALSAYGETNTLPTIAAKAACSIATSTGNVIYEKNKNEKMVPASTTKLMTALLTAENADMNKIVTIDKETADIGESEIYLMEGEQISVKDLFYALLVHSANDAAVALAKEVGGTVDNFVKMMNERAKALGANNTNFVNPSGIKADNHYSTAYDLALIGRAAFDNELVRKAAGTVEYKIAKTNKFEERQFKNTNELILDDKEIEVDGKKQKSKYEGVFAGKTGTWDDNESSLVVGLNSKGVEMVVVILDSTGKDRYSDMFKLLQYSEQNAPRYKMFAKGDVFGSAFIKHGATCFIDAVAKYDGYINFPEGISENLLTMDEVYDDMEAPIKAGDRVGEVQIFLDEELIGKVDLVATKDIEEGWFPSYIGISNTATIIIGIILLIIIIAVLVLLHLRRRTRRIRQRQRQRKLERYVQEKRMREEDRNQRDWHI